MSNKLIYLAVIILAVIIAAIVWIGKNQAQVYAWNHEGSSYDQVEISFQNLEPLDLCLSKDYTADFSNNHLSLYIDGKMIWQTDPEWFVTGYCFADSNNDGKEELNLSVWKQNSFGRSKPFWINENDFTEQYHFFVFKLEDEIVGPLWQSSALSRPNCEFKFADVNQDNEIELITIEGEYEQGRQCSGKYLAVWKWNEWGFFNQWTSKQGQFNSLRILEKNSINYILSSKQ